MALRAPLFRRLALVAAASTLITAPSAYAGEARTATLHAAHVGATGSGFQHGHCPDAQGWGWHFVVPANGDFVTLSVTFAKAGKVSLGAGQFGPPDASHAYVFTRGDDTLLSGTATVTGGKKDTFNLSHTCPGETEKPPTPTPSPTTNPPTTNPPTTNPPTTNPTTNPPTTNPPTTTPPATTEPTPTPSATTTSSSPKPSGTSSPTGEPTPSQTTSTTGTPAVSPTVKGTKLVRGSTLPQTGTSVVPLALLGAALVAIGGVAIVRSTRRRQAGRH